MNNIQAANETIRITADGYYELDGRRIELPIKDPKLVKVISPQDGEMLLNADMSGYQGDSQCITEVTVESSFAAAARLQHPLVMNFANAHSAGGGFRLGANAQEEALCRCSTLYASIASEKSKEMYTNNNLHITALESDYMLLSPDVAVFRSDDLRLLAEPFTVGVITAPAPNRHGAAFLTPKDKINSTILRRIRIILRAAAQEGYRELVLGAWGCGAFGNDPVSVAEQFRTALCDDGLGRCFDRVVFAIYGRPDGKNITAFKNVFQK